MKDKISTVFNSYRNFILYCIIGGCGVVITILTYTLLVSYSGLSYQISNAIGYAAGTAFSFISNAFLNFRVTNRLAKRFVTFALVATLGWLSSAVLLEVAVGWLGMGQLLVYPVIVVIVVLIQYSLNKRFSFSASGVAPPAGP